MIGNKGFLPILVGLGAWLATATIGNILTIFFGGLIFSWLIWKVLIPIALLLAFAGLGVLLLYYYAKDPSGKPIKAIAGVSFLIFGVVLWLKFFSGYILIPGVFSVAGATAQTQAPVASGMMLSVVSEADVGGMFTPFYLQIFIAVATLYVTWRSGKRIEKISRKRR